MKLVLVEVEAGGSEVVENHENVDDNVVEIREIIGKGEEWLGSVKSSGCGSGKSA